MRVPVPEWRVPPGDPELAFGAVGARKLPGRPLEPERADARVAAEIGGFLRTLHGTTVDVEVPRAASWRERTVQAGGLFPALAEHLSEAEIETLHAWWRDARDDERMTQYAPVLIHGDLWYGNLLVDDGLVGVVDWEGAQMGDPAQDLAPQHHLGDALAEVVLDTYGADADLRYRVQRYRALREFSGVRWSLENHDAAELAESVEKLRRTPIFAG